MRNILFILYFFSLCLLSFSCSNVLFAQRLVVDCQVDKNFINDYEPIFLDVTITNTKSKTVVFNGVNHLDISVFIRRDSHEEWRPLVVFGFFPIFLDEIQIQPYTDTTLHHLVYTTHYNYGSSSMVHDVSPGENYELNVRINTLKYSKIFPLNVSDTPLECLEFLNGLKNRHFIYGYGHIHAYNKQEQPLLELALTGLLEQDDCPSIKEAARVYELFNRTSKPFATQSELSKMYDDCLALENEVQNPYWKDFVRLVILNKWIAPRYMAE